LDNKELISCLFKKKMIIFNLYKELVMCACVRVRVSHTQHTHTIFI